MKDILSKMYAIEGGSVKKTNSVIKTKPVRIQQPAKKVIVESTLKKTGVQKANVLTESATFKVTDPKLASILRRFPYELAAFREDRTVEDDLYDALFDYYFSSGRIPHGVAIGRDGDPFTVIADELEKDLNEGPIRTPELTEEFEDVEEGIFSKPQQAVRAQSLLSPEEKKKRDMIWAARKGEVEGGSSNSAFTSAGERAGQSRAAAHNTFGFAESIDDDFNEEILMETDDTKFITDSLDKVGFVRDEDFVIENNEVVVFGEHEAKIVFYTLEIELKKIGNRVPTLTHESGETYRITISEGSDETQVDEAWTSAQAFKQASETGDFAGRGSKMMELDSEYAKLKSEKDDPRCNMQRAVEINKRMQEIKKEKFNLAGQRIKDQETMKSIDQPASSNWAAKSNKPVFGESVGETTFNEGDCVKVVGTVFGSGKVGTVVHVGQGAKFVVVKFDDNSRSSYHSSDLELCDDEELVEQKAIPQKVSQYGKRVNECVNLTVSASGEDEVSDLINRIKGICGDGITMSLTATNGEDVTALVNKMNTGKEVTTCDSEFSAMPSFNMHGLLSAMNDLEGDEYCDSVDESTENDFPYDNTGKTIIRTTNPHSLESPGGSKTYPKVAGGDNPMAKITVTNESKKLASQYMKMLNGL